MRICEFCKTFQVSHQAVYAKIKKYTAELEGHISKDKGNVTDLDPFAVNLLKPKKASYKALDERNYYLFKKNKEIVSENEQLRAEREDMASKKSDYEAVIEFLKKGNKEYADSISVLTQECERYKKECDDAQALYRVMESEFDKEKAKFDAEKANFLAEKKTIASQREALQSNVTNQFYRLKERDEQIAELKSTIAKRDNEIERLKNEISELKSQLDAAEEQTTDRQNTSKQNNIFKHIFGQDKR
ncbi:MAG: hypothetical protein ACI4KF_11560 [Huintestinicola sp.]